MTVPDTAATDPVTPTALAEAMLRLSMYERAGLAHTYVGASAPGLLLPAVLDLVAVIEWVDVAWVSLDSRSLRERSSAVAFDIMSHAAQDSPEPDPLTFEHAAGLRHALATYWNPALPRRDTLLPSSLRILLDQAQTIDEQRDTHAATVLAHATFNLVWATHLISPLVPEEAASHWQWVAELEEYIDWDAGLDDTADLRTTLDQLRDVVSTPTSTAGAVDRTDPKERAAAAGLQGDVSPRLRGLTEALAVWGLRARSFRVELGWASNHEAPIVRLVYELIATHPAALRHSPRFTLMFRAGDDLLDTQGFTVSDRTWAAHDAVNVEDSTPGLLDINTPIQTLTSIEVVTNARPGDRAEDGPLSSLRLPREIWDTLRAAGISQVRQLTDEVLDDPELLTASQRQRIREDLDYFGW